MARTIIPEEKKRASDITALKNVTPTTDRVVTIDSDADGVANEFRWDPSGNPSNADGKDVIESSITEFATGGANEGAWKRSKTPITLASNNTDVKIAPSRVDLKGGMDVSPKKTDIANASFNNSRQFSSVSDPMLSVSMNEDGTKLYMPLGNNAEQIIQYTLSTPFDLSTASEDGSPDATDDAEDVVPTKNGNTFVLITDADEYGAITPEIPFDLTNGKYDDFVDSADADDAVSGGIAESNFVAFSEKMGNPFFVDRTGTIRQFNVVTGNIALAGSLSLNVDGNATGITFSDDELRLFVVDNGGSANGNSEIIEVDLGDSVNLQGATVTGNTYVPVDGGGSELSLRGIHLASGGDKLVGINENNKVFVWDVPSHPDGDLKLSKDGNPGEISLNNSAVTSSDKSPFDPSEDMKQFQFQLPPTFDTDGLSVKLEHGTFPSSAGVLETPIFNRVKISGETAPDVRFAEEGKFTESFGREFQFEDGSRGLVMSAFINARNTKSSAVSRSGEIFNVETNRIGGIQDLSTVDKALDISTESTGAVDAEYGDNGNKLFVLDNTNAEVDGYDLSTAYDVSTATYNQSFSVSAEDGNPTAMSFSNSGAKLHVVGNNSQAIYQYTMTAWSIGTASLEGSYDYSSETTNNVVGIDFNNEPSRFTNAGDHMVLFDDAGVIQQYNVQDPYDVVTTDPSADSTEDISSIVDGTPASGTWGDGGRSFFAADSNKVYEIQVSDITASSNKYNVLDLQSSTSEVEDIGALHGENDIKGINFDKSQQSTGRRNSKALIVGQADTEVKQFNLSATVTVELVGDLAGTLKFDVSKLGGNTVETVATSGDSGFPFMEATSGFECKIEPGTRSLVAGHKITDSPDIGNGFNAIFGGGPKEPSLTLGSSNLISGRAHFVLGDNNFVAGEANKADAQNCMAVGNSNLVSALNATALGKESLANGNSSFATGLNAATDGDHSFAAGAADCLIVDDDTVPGPYASKRASTAIGGNVEARAIASMVSGVGNEMYVAGGFKTGVFAEDATGGSTEGEGFDAVNLSNFNDGSRLFSVGVGEDPDPDVDSFPSRTLDGRGKVTGFYVTLRNGTYAKHGFQVEGWNGTNNVYERVFDVDGNGNMTLASGTGVNEIATSVSNTTTDNRLLTEAAIESEYGSAAISIKDSTTSIQSANTINFGSNLSVTTDSADQVTVDASSSGSTSIDVDDSGTDKATGVNNLNFGTNLTVTDNGSGKVTIDASGSGGVNVSEDGTTVVSGSTDINFATGFGVTDDTDGTVTVDSDTRSGSATFSGDGSTTQFNIAHGLSSTPSAWTVEATSNDASGISHTTADGTNITVVYDTAPGSGTDNVTVNYFLKI